MSSYRTVQTVFVIAFLAIVFCEGVVQAVVELRRGERPQVAELFTRAPSETNLRAFEDRLEKRAWSVTAFRPAMQSARFAAYGEMGEKGLAGHDGWLFFRPGLDFVIEPWVHGTAESPDAGNPLTAIVAFRDALAERGIVLLVAPAPGKASVYPDRLSARIVRSPTHVHAHARTFMNLLDEAGVAYVDLFTVFDSERKKERTPPLYLAQDTHWSPEGLRIAATAVAERVRAEGWVEPGTSSYTERMVTVKRQGDIVRMMNAPGIAAAFSPEAVDCAQIIDPTTGERYADDPESPILVLGDSFLRIYQLDEPGSAGFIAHLAREMKMPLASIVNDGGASTLVRQELQRRPALLRGKKLVIWEFVERDLRFGMEGWQAVSLPPAKPDA